MRRHEFSDAGWAVLADFFPPRPPGRGGQWADDRTVLNGVFWRLNTGAPWRDVPDRYGPWQTVYHRFSTLRKSGLLGRMVERLQLRPDEAGLIDRDLFCIDGTNVRATRAAAGAAKKSRPRVSRPTTPSASPGAGSGPRPTWPATAAGCRWRSRSHPASGSNAPRSSG